MRAKPCCKWFENVEPIQPELTRKYRSQHQAWMRLWGSLRPPALTNASTDERRLA
jgi:hypothetical protein